MYTILLHSVIQVNLKSYISLGTCNFGSIFS